MRNKFGSFYTFLDAAKSDVSVRYSFPYVDFFGTGMKHYVCELQGSPFIWASGPKSLNTKFARARFWCNGPQFLIVLCQLRGCCGQRLNYHAFIGGGGMQTISLDDTGKACLVFVL